ncbi:MAG: hypothetical protein ABFC24_01800, partial [Methanoregulaceae archaeon]
FITGLTLLLLGISLFAGILIPCVLILKPFVFLTVSNALQEGTGLLCAVSCFLAYRLSARKRMLLLAAFGFLGWTISNLFWFSYRVLVNIHPQYPTISGIGFLGFFLFLALAFRTEFRNYGIPPGQAIILFAIFLGVPLLNLVMNGLTTGPVFFLLYFLLSAYLIGTALQCRIYRYKILFLGTAGYCCAEILYIIRETMIYRDTHLFSLLFISGLLVVISFAVIQIGLFRYLREEREKPDPGTES